MKKAFFAITACLMLALSANAQSWLTPSTNYGNSSSSKIGTDVNTSSIHVDSYYRTDGTFVRSHERSAINSTNLDNYSTAGNINPYTGSVGSRAADYSVESQNYGAGRTIHTGPRGGQYYINSNGNRTYVPKR